MNTEAAGFPALCSDIAREMSAVRGEAWTTRGQQSSTVTLCGPKDAAIMLSDGWRHAGKIAASGLFPTGYGRGTYEANVAISRGARTIAREVSRRIIDAGYQDALAEAVAAKAERDHRDSVQVDLLRRAAAVVGGGDPGAPDAEVRFGRYHHAGDTMHGTVKSYWRGRGLLSFEVTAVPAETAMRVLAVLAECARAQAPAPDERGTS